MSCTKEPYDDSYKHIIISHRGMWRLPGSYENSISSVKNALDAGVYGVEVDVRQTSDGEFVICHDETHADQIIAETSFEILRRTPLPNGEAIPSLTEILDLFSLNNDTMLYLEVKYSDIHNLLKVTDEYDLDDRIIFISFSQAYCEALIEAGKRVMLLNGSLTPKELKNKGYWGIDYQYDVLLNNPDIINEYRDEGLHVAAWTINEKERFQDIQNIGVEYITTDLSTQDW